MGKPEITKYVFSGHESFPCKSLWLKKGYDFVKNGNDFNSPKAVIHLEVGKNHEDHTTPLIDLDFFRQTEESNTSCFDFEEKRQYLHTIYHLLLLSVIDSDNFTTIKSFLLW